MVKVPMWKGKPAQGTKRTGMAVCLEEKKQAGERRHSPIIAGSQSRGAEAKYFSIKEISAKSGHY